MSRARVSIATLIGIVVVAGFGLAALREASPHWVLGTAILTSGLLLTAILGALWLRGLDRAFWSGFALFGWSHLGLLNWPWAVDQVGFDASYLLNEASAYVRQSQPSEWYFNYVKVGHFLLVLLLALVGGFIARAFAARTARASAGTAG